MCVCGWIGMSGTASSDTLCSQWTGLNGDEGADVEEKAIQPIHKTLDKSVTGAVPCTMV